MRAAVAAVAALACLLAGCGSRSDKELAAVKSARSVMSEWALVEEQAEADHAPATYIEQMREAAKDQLKAASSELSGKPEAARLIDELRGGSPDADRLKEASSALEPLEKRLEAA